MTINAHIVAAHPIVKALQRRLGDTLRFGFRHFPLTAIHEYAESAAEAAEVAGAQGKFWEMHDPLFENQPALDYESLVRYGEELGLDVERFATELENQISAPRVREDFISGMRSGVNGAPTFFINGVRHEGSFDFENDVGGNSSSHDGSGRLGTGRNKTEVKRLCQ